MNYKNYKENPFNIKLKQLYINYKNNLHPLIKVTKSTYLLDSNNKLIDDEIEIANLYNYFFHLLHMNLQMP